MNDLFVRFIIEYCQKLKVLSLNSSEELTDNCFMNFKIENKSLKILNIDKCYATDNALIAISNIFFNLKELSIQHYY